MMRKMTRKLFSFDQYIDLQTNNFTCQTQCFEIAYLNIIMQNCKRAFLAVSLAISFTEAFWHTLQVPYSS